MPTPNRIPVPILVRRPLQNAGCRGTTGGATADGAVQAYQAGGTAAEGKKLMTPAEMEAAANDALAAGTHMTLSHPRDGERPKTFPSGNLLGENFDGTNFYSYDPLKVLTWLKANGLVNVVAQRETQRHEGDQQ